MAELMAKSPCAASCAGVLPITRADATLAEVDVGPMTMVQPFKGRDAEVAEALGMALPKPNRSGGKAGARVIWFGKESYLCMGIAVSDMDAAAISDQSDAWCVVSLEGAGAETILARLVPVDLRGKTFKLGHTCRTELGHMSASITRTGKNTFQIMVFRSMAHTLVHELSETMDLVAARSGI